MNECLFCNIARKEMPSDVVYEDDHTLAFLDVRPCALGHTMVIPKAHAANLSDLSDEEIQPFFGAVKRVTDRIGRALTPDGFTLGMNYGAAGGQKVEHIHFHIIPRWEGDGGTSLHGVVQNTPTEALAATAARIRNAGE